MRFQVSRSSLGATSKDAPCRGAVRGPEAAAWPGEYVWYVDLGTLEELHDFLTANGGGLGLFGPEEGEDHPVIEIFDDEEEEE
jgi:hypothetical protein